MRTPDLTIGPKSDPQTERWHLFRWRGMQVALHKWWRSDNDRALHDHSADNISIPLTGCYREWTSHAWQTPRFHVRYPLIPVYRRAEMPHRIEITGRPIWSLWIRFPPRREWGFHCRAGWRHWKEYIAERDYQTPGSESTVGKGCD